MNDDRKKKHRRKRNRKKKCQRKKNDPCCTDKNYCCIYTNRVKDIFVISTQVMGVPAKILGAASNGLF